MYTFADFGVQYQKVQLKNGSEVRLLQKTGAPIHIQACIHAGSRHNPIPGLAHFLEHMLVAGTHSYPSKLDLANALEEVGGTFDAVTDADLVRITISIPNADDIPLAVTILNEILTASVFDKDAFKNEQLAILNEQKDREQHVVSLLQDSLLNLMYPDYELHFKGLGTTESVSKIQRDDVTAFAAENITSSRTTYIVAGDVTIEAITKQLNKITLPQNSQETKPPLLPTEANNRAAFHSRSGDQADLSIGFRCDTKYPEELAGLILIQQMFQGRSSQFINELRYKKGLVYGGKTLFWDFNGTGIFSIGTSCAAENVLTVYNIMYQIIDDIATRGITAAECAVLQTKIDSYYRFHLQTARQWVEAEAAAVRHTVEAGPDNHALTILSYLEQMDANKLTAVFRKFFDTSDAYRALIGSLSDETLQQI